MIKWWYALSSNKNTRRSHNQFIRLLSMFLAFALAFSCTGTQVFADDGDIAKNGGGSLNYLAIGDSTCSAYNSDEFVYSGLRDDRCVENKNIYPNLMGKFLEETLNREVNVNCILPEGIRANDLRAILDPEYHGDVYCQNHISQWSDRYGSYAQLHENISNAIANADFMSIDVCMSALGNYFSDRLKVATGLKNDKSYEEFYGNDRIETILEGNCMALDLILSCRNTARKLLANMGMPIDLIPRIIETYEYSVGSLMINFTEAVKRIYALNNDIQLIVMSPFITTCYDLTLTWNGLSFSLGSILRLYISTMYNYIVNWDPNHNRYMVADMYHSYLRCFTDAIADGEWDKYTYVTNEIRNILLSKNIPVSADNDEQEAYFRNTVCKNVEKAFKQKKFNVNFMLPDILKELLNEGDNVINALVASAANDYDHASEISKLSLRLALVFESWGCHPDYSGHMQKFEAMRKAYEKKNCKEKKTCVLNVFNGMTTRIKEATKEKANCKHQNMKHISAKKPTLFKFGNIEFYMCKNCGGYFSDESGLCCLSKNSVIVYFGKKSQENVTMLKTAPVITKNVLR